ncbi:hypothetical protein EDC04DRAFT_853901 [Pisolithus marmoratus]|nr:hypothetical protein EDC04DRAFT_853901 [Pisolithus marmoratus]
MSVDYPDELLEAIIAPELSHLDANTRNMDPVFSRISSVFSEVFPNIRHLEIGEFASAFFHGLQERTDLWSDLERVTFRSLHASVLEGTVTELQTWLRQRKPTAKPLHLQFTCIKRRSYWETTGDILSMLYDSLHEDCTFEVDQFPLMERTRKGFLTRTLRTDLPGNPPCIYNMPSGEDVLWPESADEVQDELEDESDQ